jgi:cell division protein FtsZ
LLQLDLKLTDFPYSAPGYGRKVAVVCIGSAGCKIGSQLSKESKLLEHFVYISCDDHDIASITKGERILLDIGGASKSTPFKLRGISSAKLPEIRQNIGDSDIVFIIAGLGGTVGSGIAPLIAREASARGAVTVAIMVMPYNFERSKHFFAGTALRQVRKYASGVIVIDNDELLQQDLPVIDAYALVNQKIALALNKLLGSTEQHEFSIGLNNVVDFVKTNSYSVLCLGDSQMISGYRQAVISAASHFDKTVDKGEASRSLVHLCTDKSITMNELVSSIGGLSGVLGSGSMQIEYGLSANSTSTSTAIIMATGFSTTKFDSYDPIDMALGSPAANLEEDMDQVLDFSPLMSNMEMDS